MASIDNALIVKLREKTGAGILECKHALEEAGGDSAAAERILRERGALKATSKSARLTGQGVVAAHVHMGKIGVLVEVNCETDFVARNEEFRLFAEDIAVHIAAMDPAYIRPEEVPEAVLDEERARYAREAKDKPADIAERIIAEKLDDFYSRTCLLRQPFFKDSGKIVEAAINEKISKIGENIVVRRFCRFVLGA